MISDKTKENIKAMTIEEMAYEVNLAHVSRFQREKFAYLKTCYESQTESERLTKIPEPTTEANTRSINNKLNWYDMALGKIAVGVIIVILSAITIWSFNHYFSIEL